MSKANSSAPSISRRSFLTVSGAAFALLLAPSGTRHVLAAAAVPATATKKKIPVGLELYSVRNELMRDLPKTLVTVAAMGYEVVEFYSPYFDWTPPYAKEVRPRMDDLGSRCYSTHNHIESFTPGETMGKAMKLNQILGTRYVVMASSPRGARAMEGWKRLCGQLSTANDQLLPPERQSPAQPGWRFTGTARQIRKRCSTPPADWGHGMMRSARIFRPRLT